MAANREVLAYLVEGARRRGIDASTAVRAFGHEGLNVFDPNKPDRGGDEGSSFGPYQLHYAGMSRSMPNAGMGDDFTRTTGLDARDPSTWKAQTDFVLDHLANGGTWAPWMGAKAEGITGRMGLPGGPAGPQPGEATVAQYRAGQADGKPVYVANVPETPVQPPTAAPVATADASPAPKGKNTLRQKLAKLATGFSPPAVAQGTVDMAALRPTPAARVDTPTIAPFDQSDVASQRQNLAMALQRLNTGKLWI